MTGNSLYQLYMVMTGDGLLLLLLLLLYPHDFGIVPNSQDFHIFPMSESFQLTYLVLLNVSQGFPMFLQFHHVPTPDSRFCQKPQVLLREGGQRHVSEMKMDRWDTG